MTMPGFTADTSVYISGLHYYLGTALSLGPTPYLNPAQLGALPIKLPNGGNGGCDCKPHLGPCTVKDSTCASGFSRFVTDCDCNTDTVCCTKPCTTPPTCGTCTGGSCGSYPTCAGTPGTQTCTNNCTGATFTRNC